MNIMELKDLLKSKRKSILTQMYRIRSAKALYEIQKKIAEEIKNSEKFIKQDASGEYKWNIHLLRCCCDAIVWKLLQVHTIRQLMKNPSPPQSLSNQGEAFDLTLKTAKEYSDKGLPVIIADITNCIKIGDIVICTNPELPTIVECKGGRHSPEKIMQGRIGRQFSRAMGTLEYLTNGQAKVFGEPEARIVIETAAEVKYNWKIVNKTVKEALKRGEGFGITNNYDVMWAFRNDDENVYIPKEIKDLISKFKTPIVSCHLRAIEELGFLISPPLAWPINLECQIALMEGDIILFHLIDSDRFLQIKKPYGKIKKILFGNKYTKEYCFVVKVKEHYIKLSSRFLDEVIYGYATIESITGNMIEFALKCSEVSISPKIIMEKKKPQIKVVKTIEDALQLVKEKDTINKESFVIIPKSLLEKLEKIKNIT